MAWPSSDTFDDGDPFVDTFSPFAWARCAPWTTDSVTGYGGVMLAFEQLDVYLYDGWYTTPGGMQMPGSPSSTPLVATNPGTDQEEPTCFVFRDYVTTDATVEISFNEVGFQAGGGSITWRSLFMGVGARIGSSGSITGGGAADTTILRSVSGYWAFLAWHSSVNGGAPYWVLVRSNGTSVALLASSAAGTLNLSESRRVRMRIEDTTGGDPHIIVETATSIIFEGAPEWTEIFDYTDTNAAKITNPGRIGFMTTSEQGALYAADGVARAYLVNYVAVQDFDATADVWRDDGSRFARTAGRVVNSALKTGRCIQSAWFGDLYTTGTLTQMRQDIGANRITFDPATTGSSVEGFYASQRRATDPVAQDRSAEFVFVSGGGSPASTRKCGIALRVSNIDTPGDSLGFCYFAFLQRDDTSGAGSIHLYRKRTTALGADNERLMASKTGVTLTENTAYRLRLQVANQETTGYVLLKVYFAGSQSVLTLDPAFVGLQVDSLGTVTDPTTNLIASGPGEALYLSIPDSVGHTIAVNDWTEGSNVVGADVQEQNQLGIAVPTETAALSGTLTVPIDWDVTMTRGQVARRVDLEGGYVYANVARTFQRRTWKVGQQAALEEEVLTLREFWDDHRGPEIPFYWTAPGDEDPTVVKFTDNQLTDRLKAPGVYDFSFELEELTSGV